MSKTATKKQQSQELASRLSVTSGRDELAHYVSVWHGDRLLAECHHDQSQRGIAMAEAAARQFAASQELLEAAYFSMSVHKSQGLYDLSERMAVERLERAIASATSPVEG